MDSCNYIWRSTKLRFFTIRAISDQCKRSDVYNAGLTGIRTNSGMETNQFCSQIELDTFTCYVVIYNLLLVRIVDKFEAAEIPVINSTWTL